MKPLVRHRGRRRCRFPASFLRALTGIVLLPVAACGPDVGQVLICERLVQEFVEPGETIEIIASAQDRLAANTINIDYLAIRPDGVRRQRRLACRFAGGRFDDDNLILTGLRTDDDGELAPQSVMRIRRKYRLQ